MGRMTVGAFGPSGKVFHARLVAEDTRNHAPPLSAKLLVQTPAVDSFPEDLAV